MADQGNPTTGSADGDSPGTQQSMTLTSRTSALAMVAGLPIVNRRDVLHPTGEDEIVTSGDRGRRGYHLRPQPRARADLSGFNVTFCLLCAVVIVIVIVFPPW
jgi:hypothetical protein